MEREVIGRPYGQNKVVQFPICQMHIFNIAKSASLIAATRSSQSAWLVLLLTNSNRMELKANIGQTLCAAGGCILVKRRYWVALHFTLVIHSIVHNSLATPRSIPSTSLTTQLISILFLYRSQPPLFCADFATRFYVIVTSLNLSHSADLW